MKLDDFTLIPGDFREKDPRQLAYMFPQSIISSQQKFIAYNKKMQTFVYYHSLDVAETMAKLMDYVLLPTSILHWRRAKQLGADRRVQIGRNVFYLVKQNELTSKERERLLDFAQEIRSEVSSL